MTTATENDGLIEYAVTYERRVVTNFFVRALTPDLARAAVEEEVRLDPEDKQLEVMSEFDRGTVKYVSEIGEGG